MFSAFRMSPAASGSMISMEYYSELLKHVPKNWKGLVRRKYTDNFSI